MLWVVSEDIVSITIIDVTVDDKDDSDDCLFSY